MSTLRLGCFVTIVATVFACKVVVDLVVLLLIIAPFVVKSRPKKVENKLTDDRSCCSGANSTNSYKLQQHRNVGLSVTVGGVTTRLLLLLVIAADDFNGNKNNSIALTASNLRKTMSSSQCRVVSLSLVRTSLVTPHHVQHQAYAFHHLTTSHTTCQIE